MIRVNRFTTKINLHQERQDVGRFRKAIRQKLNQLCNYSVTDVSDEFSYDFDEETWLVYRGLSNAKSREQKKVALERATYLLKTQSSQPHQWNGLNFISCQKPLWAIASLEEQNQEVLNDTGFHPQMKIGSHIAKQSEERVNIAIDTLKVIWPEMASQLSLLCTRIVWFRAPSFWSSTAPYAHGAIFVNPLTEWGICHFMDTLAHESGHLSLMIKQTFDPMLLNPQQRQESPLRKDSRPLIGIWHAVFVLFRICKALTYYLNSNFNHGDRDQAAVLLLDYQSRLSKGIQTLALAAEWTDSGRVFYEELLSDALDLGLLKRAA